MNRFLTWCTAYPSRIFLLGIMLGILIMRVRAEIVIRELLNTPVIIAEPVDNVFERYTEYHTFVIHDCPKRGKDLTIRIRTQPEVRAFGRSETGEDVEGLLGYTDTKGNRIMCVNSMEVLIHEIRHIFEGPYHRNLPPGGDHEAIDTAYN